MSEWNLTAADHGIPLTEMAHTQLVKQMAESVRGDLAMAYGGYSRITEKEIAEAIKGRYENGNDPFLRCRFVVEVLTEALNQEEERWEALTETTIKAEYWYACRTVCEFEFGIWLEGRIKPRPVGVVRAPAIVD